MGLNPHAGDKGYIGDEEENIIDTVDETFVESSCDCSVCSNVNKYKKQWETWTPTNNVETIFDNSIINIDKQFNL